MSGRSSEVTDLGSHASNWGHGSGWVAILFGILGMTGLGVGGLSSTGFMAVLVTILLLGLGVELSRLRRALGGSELRPPSEDRPADGRVDIVAWPDVRSVENSCDPRFRRFVGFEPGHEPSQTNRSAGLPVLRGRVAIVSLFLGLRGQIWSDAEIGRAHASLLRAGRWIEREAICWGAAVNIELAETYFSASVDMSADVELGFMAEEHRIGLSDANETGKILIAVARSASALGCGNATELIAQTARRIDAGSIAWLIHVRSAGRSMALIDAWPGVRMGVCYVRYADFPEPMRETPCPDSATMVHELLHLFGAKDKYGISLMAFPADSVTPRDIMRMGESGLSRLRIDPRTASEIGWLPEWRA